MNKLLHLLLLIPFHGYSQEISDRKDTANRGIYFQEGLSWQQIRAKAKANKKYIFIDCFATWCGPCKLMDEEVYTKQNVGDFMNANFISVKVQMDTTSKDNKEVQKWYADAQIIKTKFKIETFPVYLFFSPEGKIVHRFSGAIKDTDFVNVSMNSLNPEKQYYTLLNKYQNGKKEYSAMLYLANIAKMNGDKKVANTIANDYIKNYLDKQNETELYSKNNIDFISSFIDLVNSKDKVFRLLYEHGDSIDNIMDWRGYAEGEVRYIISKEEIDPRLWPDNKPIKKKPDWGKLYSIIEKKYTKKYTGYVIIDAKLRWYNEKKDWPEITKYTVLKIEKYGLDTAGLAKYLTNNLLYEVIFQHSDNKEEINKAVEWMKIIVESTENYADGIDTYANLLYKAGRIQEALTWEEKAAKLKPENGEIQSSFEKMKKREPTWK